jgi:hypothetical protein
MKWDAKESGDGLFEGTDRAAEKSTKNFIQISGPPRRIELGAEYEAGILTSQPRCSVCVCVYVWPSLCSLVPFTHFVISVSHKRYSETYF